MWGARTCAFPCYFRLLATILACKQCGCLQFSFHSFYYVEISVYFFLPSRLFNLPNFFPNNNTYLVFSTTVQISFCRLLLFWRNCLSKIVQKFGFVREDKEVTISHSVFRNINRRTWSSTCRRVNEREVLIFSLSLRIPPPPSLVSMDNVDIKSSVKIRSGFLADL